MTILIYQIKSTGEKNLIAVAPLELLNEVQLYCNRRNHESIAAGYNMSYQYDRCAATIIKNADALQSL